MIDINKKFMHPDNKHSLPTSKQKGSVKVLLHLPHQTGTATSSPAIETASQSNMNIANVTVGKQKPLQNIAILFEEEQ